MPPCFEQELTPAAEQQYTGATQKSVRTLSQHPGVSFSMVRRVWRQHNLQPHRLHRLNRQSAPASNAIYSVEDPIENESAIQEFMSSTSRVEVLDQ